MFPLWEESNAPVLAVRRRSKDQEKKGSRYKKVTVASKKVKRPNFCRDCGAEIIGRGSSAKVCVNCIPEKYLRELEAVHGHRGAHWKSKTPGAVQQYINQDATEDEVIVRHVQTHSTMMSVRLPKRCRDCGSTRPYCGFAPVFNLNPIGGSENLVLVCEDCYDKRCLKEHLLERKVG